PAGVADSPRATDSSLQGPHKPRSRAMASILVVDDNDKLRRVLRAFLEAEEHQVTGVANGAEALRAIRSEAFDLVLCDVFMPGLDGLETLRQLRREFPIQRALVMSGEDKLGLLDASGLLESVPFLKKPFSYDDVKAAV